VAKVKQHMGVAVTGPTPSLGVPFVAQPVLSPATRPVAKRGRAAVQPTASRTRGISDRATTPFVPALPRPAAAQSARAPKRSRTAAPPVSIEAVPVRRVREGKKSKRAEAVAPVAAAPAIQAAVEATSPAQTRKAGKTPVRAKGLARNPGAGVAVRAAATPAAKAAAPRRDAAKKVRKKVRSTAAGRAERAGDARGVRRPKAAVAPARTRGGSRPKSAVRKPASSARRSAAKGKAPRGAARAKGAIKGRKQMAHLPVARVVKIKALDPFEMCGRRTSVVHLLRVDERQDGASAVHLVFFDRHGWYCEHGPACRAVEDVRRQRKQLGLTI